MSVLAWCKVWSQDLGWTCNISERVLCKCASVTGTEVQLLRIATYCWKMKSVIDRSHKVTHIVNMSPIAGLNYK